MCDEPPVKLSKHRRSKARGPSSHRSKSRDNTNDSWVARNRQLIYSKVKHKKRASRENSGIPLYQRPDNKSADRGRKKLIVNVECPVKWTPEDSHLTEQQRSRVGSLDRNNREHVEQILSTSQNEDRLNFSGSTSKWGGANSGYMNPDELRTSQNLENENETYKSFLKMIKEKNQKDSEIKIYN